ncbi:hypothetical protein AaE_014432 [Aphanomyces astaci]|uniref:Uncharacterized protein n=1 Tax=Aphanomyces astaci TaxID=112090 RepID=A0A6A4Z5Y3_APHAT|nr:hypothetical protein AaE_014432 [Aphanomyces astaci]
MERYFRYEAAGDQYMGRVVAVNSHEFAVLPPRFPADSDPLLEPSLKVMFPGLCEKVTLRPLLKMVLASMVYHFVYLNTLLPALHALKSTALFTNSAMLKNLQRNLISGYTSQFIQASGIPPHVEDYTRLESNNSAILSIPQLVLDGLSVYHIGRKAIGAGNITKEVLKATLIEVYRQRQPLQLKVKPPPLEIPVQTKPINHLNGVGRFVMSRLFCPASTLHLRGGCGGLVILVSM